MNLFLDVQLELEAMTLHALVEKIERNDTHHRILVLDPRLDVLYRLRYPCKADESHRGFGCELAPLKSRSPAEHLDSRGYKCCILSARVWRQKALRPGKAKAAGSRCLLYERTPVC